MFITVVDENLRRIFMFFKKTEQNFEKHLKFPKISVSIVHGE